MMIYDDISTILSSNAAIAVYIIVFSLLVVVISVSTVLDVRKKMKFRKQNNLETMEKEKNKKNTRFPELSQFDATHKDYEPEENTGPSTLKEICDLFREYNASDASPKKLYYSISDIRKFVASLGVSKTMILQGMSGTGKTSLAVAFGNFINVSSTVVPVQPMWKERSDLLGYYNEFTGKFNETVILSKLYEANFSDKMFIIILDELNIARVEYYFSEFLSLLELPANSERKLIVAAAGAKGDPRKMSHGQIDLPDNVWFLGTANNDDSTFAISDKVYDRAMILNLNNRADPFTISTNPQSIHLSATRFKELVEKAQAEITLSKSGKEKLDELDEYLVEKFHVTFGNRIMMQIKKYVPIFVACGGTEEEALDDIISKKILRKLEAQNPVYVKTHSEELIRRFDEIFGQDVMKDCISYIHQLSNNG